jgi:hypothetical protein
VNTEAGSSTYTLVNIQILILEYFFISELLDAFFLLPKVQLKVKLGDALLPLFKF